MTVFFLCGLWHGASWNFVLWGLLHGSVLVAERTFDLREAEPGSTRPLSWLPRAVITQLLVMLAWVVFRCTDLTTAHQFYRGLFGRAAGATTSDPSLSGLWWIWIGVLATLHFALRRRDLFERSEPLPDWAFALAFGAGAALALPWVAARYQPFIYFQF